MTDIDNENNRFNDPEDDFEGYNEPDDEFEEDDDSDPEYTVGYRKPPRHTQFKKGQSGNPKGRPKSKESENQADSLAKELSTTVHLKINGETQNMKAMDAISKQIVAQAIKGNISILKKFMDSPVLDTYLFKDAMNKYNCPPENKPKVLPQELRLIVNKARSIMQQKLDKEKEESEVK